MQWSYTKKGRGQMLVSLSLFCTICGKRQRRKTKNPGAWTASGFSVNISGSAGLVDVVFNKVLASHVGRLLQSHDVED